MSVAEQATGLCRTLDKDIHNFAVCEVQRGFRLVGAPVNAATLYLVLAGDMHMVLPEGAEVVAPRGAIVLMPPGIPPAIAPVSGPAIDLAATRNLLVRSEGLPVFDAAHGGRGDLRVLVGRIAEGEAGTVQLFAGRAAPMVDDMRGLKSVREAFRQILAELDQPRPGSAALAAALMKTCMVHFSRRLARASENVGPALTPVDGRFSAVAGAVLARPAEPHNVNSLAAIAGMSRSTFTRQFTEALGISPMDYVLRLRLNHAAGLLESSQMPVKQVAAASGFLSRTHFSRAFRAAYGTDPSSYRAARPIAVEDSVRASPSAALPLLIQA